MPRQPFNPYIQLKPSQRISEFFSGAHSEQIARTEGVGDTRKGALGKALVELVPGLTETLSKLQDPERKRQEAQAQKLVEEDKANQLAKTLQEHIKKGTVPAGYSIYLVKQVSKHLARKGFAEFELATNSALKQFEDPLYAEGSEDAYERLAAETFQKLHLDGYENSPEFQEEWNSRYMDRKGKWRARAEALRTNGKHSRARDIAVADAVALWNDHLIEGRVADTVTSLPDQWKQIAQDLREAGVPLKDGVNKFLFNALADHLKTLHAEIQIGEEDAVDEAEALVQILGNVNLQGQPKTAWAHMFASELQGFQAAIVRSEEIGEKHADDPAYPDMASSARGALLAIKGWRDGNYMALLEQDTEPTLQNIHALIDSYAEAHPDIPISNGVRRSIAGLMMDELRQARAGVLREDRTQAADRANEVESEGIQRLMQAGDVETLNNTFEELLKELDKAGLTPLYRSMVVGRLRNAKTSRADRINGVANAGQKIWNIEHKKGFEQVAIHEAKLRAELDALGIEITPEVERQLTAGASAIESWVATEAIKTAARFASETLPSLNLDNLPDAQRGMLEAVGKYIREDYEPTRFKGVDKRFEALGRAIKGTKEAVKAADKQSREDWAKTINLADDRLAEFLNARATMSIWEFFADVERRVEGLGRSASEAAEFQQAYLGAPVNRQQIAALETKNLNEVVNGVGAFREAFRFLEAHPDAHGLAWDEASGRMIAKPGATGLFTSVEDLEEKTKNLQSGQDEYQALRAMLHGIPTSDGGVLDERIIRKNAAGVVVDEKGLAIPEFLLNPSTSIVLRRISLDTGPKTTPAGAEVRANNDFIAAWASKTPQEETLKNWNTDAAKVYKALPERYQGDPVAFLRQQSALFHTTVEHLQKNKNRQAEVDSEAKWLLRVR